jgi:uncharacterized protein YndB with AHSA1/START domain/DNA-binding transcriptional ArsR family regulator
MDEVFRALADPSRRALLDSLNARNGQTLRELCAGLDMTRQSVSKHLAVLAAANLVSTLWRGREKLHYLNAVPINAIAERWINRYDQRRVRALADLKTALESTVDSPEFVYTTYIDTTPEKLWQALTEPAFTEQYWGTRFGSDWRKGSTMTWSMKNWTSVSDEQVVLESEPYTRLSYTWHDMGPDFAAAFDFPAEEVAAFAAEPRSRVTFTLEPLGELVRLTVEHTGFPPGSKVYEGIRGGWPAIIASLKTLLETGKPLPDPTTAP